MNNDRFDRLETKIDKLSEEIRGLSIKHEIRISGLEKFQKGVITVGGALLTAIAGAIAKLFHLGAAL